MKLDTARVTGYVQSGTLTFAIRPAFSWIERMADVVVSTKNWWKTMPDIR